MLVQIQGRTGAGWTEEEVLERESRQVETANTAKATKLHLPLAADWKQTLFILWPALNLLSDSVHYN